MPLAALLPILVAPTVGCPRSHDDAKPAPVVSIAKSATVMQAAPSSSAPAQPTAACVVAYASSPVGVSAGVAVGDDLSDVAAPMRVAAGVSITIELRRSGHQVTIHGPAALRPCTRAEPDVVLLASGEATTDTFANVRPGAEMFLATPSFVAIFGRATLKVRVEPSTASYQVDAGEVDITSLDTTRHAKAHDDDYVRRYEDGGVLQTRCLVQATSAASATRLLDAIGRDAGPALPASSVGILAVEQMKHTRERTLDCAFAAAFALSCDLNDADRAAMTGDEVARSLGKSGCAGGLAQTERRMAKAAASFTLPEWGPHPPVPSASPASSTSASSSASTPPASPSTVASAPASTAPPATSIGAPPR